MEATVITVGTFDGVHRGHQAILGRLREVAREGGLAALVYTFSFPPRHTSQAQSQPAACLLLSPSAKRKLLTQYADRVEQVDFLSVRNLSAGQFVHQVLLGRYAAQTIVVGESFRFGRNREGDVYLLDQLTTEKGVSVVSVPPVEVDHIPVSSSRIRRQIQSGAVHQARRLLGRPPILVGEVVAGDRLGRKLGYPTANLALDPVLLLPATGIYLVYAFWGQKQGAGLLYLGGRPTLRSTTPRCEVYLLAPPKAELYGETMEVHLLERLRDDQVFSSLEALRQQLDHDVEQAQSLLRSYEEEDLNPILA